MRTFLIPSRSCLPRRDLSLFEERKGINNDNKEWREHTGVLVQPDMVQSSYRTPGKRADSERQRKRTRFLKSEQAMYFEACLEIKQS